MYDKITYIHFFLTSPIFFAIILLQEFYMTKDTDHPLKICLSDGIHTYYGYDEKPSVATGKTLCFCTGGGILYIPLTTLNKHAHSLNLRVDNQTMKPIEDELQFTIDIWYEKTGGGQYSNGQFGSITYASGTSYLKFESDTSEEITVRSTSVRDLSGQIVSKIYSGNLYKIVEDGVRPVIGGGPGYFEYQGEHTLQQVEWNYPNISGEHSYYTFYKYQ